MLADPRSGPQLKRIFVEWLGLDRQALAHLIGTFRRHGEAHVQAAVSDDRSFAIAYLPFGHRIGVRMAAISGKQVRAQWFNPRAGTWTRIGSYPNAGIRELTPPAEGEGNDWVLVIDRLEEAG